MDAQALIFFMIQSALALGSQKKNGYLMQKSCSQFKFSMDRTGRKLVARLFFYHSGMIDGYDLQPSLVG